MCHPAILGAASREWRSLVALAADAADAMPGDDPAPASRAGNRDRSEIRARRTSPRPASPRPPGTARLPLPDRGLPDHGLPDRSLPDRGLLNLPVARPQVRRGGPPLDELSDRVDRLRHLAWTLADLEAHRRPCTRTSRPSAGPCTVRRTPPMRHSPAARLTVKLASATSQPWPARRPARPGGRRCSPAARAAHPASEHPPDPGRATGHRSPAEPGGAQRGAAVPPGGGMDAQPDRRVLRRCGRAQRPGGSRGPGARGPAAPRSRDPQRHPGPAARPRRSPGWPIRSSPRRRPRYVGWRPATGWCHRAAEPGAGQRADLPARSLATPARPPASAARPPDRRP